MSQPMKFALVGYGHIGKVHADALTQIKNAKLVAIIDAKPIDSEMPHFHSIQEFIDANIHTDTIIIATPNGMHYAMAKVALEAGYHVVVEKPITLTSHDLSDLIHLAESEKKRLFNMLQLRFSPVVQWFKELLDSNELGEIYMVNTHCYWNRNAAYYEKRQWHGSKEQDGGVLFTQFSHFVDVLHYWFHKLKVKDIRSYNFNHKGLTAFADSGMINFEIPEGGCGNLIYTTSTYQKNFDSTITIIAEKGTIQIAGQYMNQIRFLNIGDTKNPFQEEVGKHFHAKALEEISAAIQEKRPSILDAENARNVIQFLEVVS
ncbi:gfo/Idh/MocA family oxidoreductase [Flavobacteriaceae bacterium Ap0902]|nr:gfo/Idh/MocA family oxidoreductase [Flavobacteriaceae bacterium Ap0902]